MVGRFEWVGLASSTQRLVALCLLDEALKLVIVHGWRLGLNEILECVFPGSGGPAELVGCLVVPRIRLIVGGRRCVVCVVAGVSHTISDGLLQALDDVDVAFASSRTLSWLCQSSHP